MCWCLGVLVFWGFRGFRGFGFRGLGSKIFEIGFQCLWILMKVVFTANNKKCMF